MRTKETRLEAISIDLAPFSIGFLLADFLDSARHLQLLESETETKIEVPPQYHLDLPPDKDKNDTRNSSMRVTSACAVLFTLTYQTVLVAKMRHDVRHAEI